MQSKDDLSTLFVNKIRSLPSLLSLRKEDRQQYRLMHTSGTTGIPLPVLYTKRPDWNSNFLGEGSRVLMLFGSKPLRLDFAEANNSVLKYKRDMLFLNQNLDDQLVKQSVLDFKPDIIVSPPSFLLRQSLCWADEERSRITSIIIAGELADEHSICEIKKRFTNAGVVSTYSSMETGIMGLSCPRCRVNEFHPYVGVSFSIFNSDNEGVGDLLVSKDNPGAVLLTDYLIGDVAKITNTHNDTTIQLFGRRGYDYIKLSGVLLLREEFDRVSRELGDYFIDYKAEVSSMLTDGVRQHCLTLYVVLNQVTKKTQNIDIDFLALEFAKKLYVTPSSSLEDAISKKIFTPLKVIAVDQITHKTIKPQRLVQI